MTTADTLGELMRSPIVTIEESATVAQAISLMGDRAIGSIVVTRHGTIVGLFTERDVLRRILEDRELLERTMGSVMSVPIVSIASDAVVQEAFDLMTARGIRRLLVTRGQDVVGIVTDRDLLRWVSDVGREPT